VLTVRDREPADEAAVAPFLERWHSARVARLGRIEVPLEHPALLAEEDGRLVGVLTYVPGPERSEVLTLHCDERGRGVGTALLEAAAERLGPLWLVTTNDNVDALRFYQRRGFRLAALNAGAVDDARARLKPEIPEVGDHGIPIRDELVLERP
jgi:ribosomal protein S18 acetylase RimI-like enzyme